MADHTSTVQEIVDASCSKLLKGMRHGHHGADVGISVALYYPADSKVPGFFKYGSAGPGTEITDETVYAIGSVTKVFTATLAAYLSVHGTIGPLGQTLVGPYLSNPGCKPSGVSGPYWGDAAASSFLRFATQTSGMPDEAGGHYSEQLFASEPPSCPQIAWWNDKQRDFERAQGSWIYSSAGFVTLGFAVAAAAAQGGWTGGYPALLKDVITTPVGMPCTFAADDVPAGAVLATGYDKHTRPDSGVCITRADDLKSTAKDMLVWLAAVYQAMQLRASGGTMTPLQEALADTAHPWIADPRKPDKSPTGFEMGLGWQIPTFGSARVLAKDGSTSKGGCSCLAGLTLYDPAVPPAGIVLMTNQVGVSPNDTARTILQQIIAQG